MIREDVLSEAALELLASSTARRYMRQAQRLAASSGLVNAVRDDPTARTDAQARVIELLRQLETERERSLAEFEAALLLCALARADGLSATVRRATESRSAWLRSLALRLISLGPASSEEIAALEIQIASILSGQVVVGEPPEPSDCVDPSSFPRAA